MAVCRGFERQAHRYNLRKYTQGVQEEGSLMASHGSPTQPAAGGDGPKARSHLFPRWRVFTWVILAFNVIMLIWAIAGASTSESCKGLVGDELTICQAGQVGTGIGVGLIILLWALGDIILGVVWLITRPHSRYCPVCGNKVRRGVMQCRDCGFDFRQAVTPPKPGSEPPGA